MAESLGFYVHDQTANGQVVIDLRGEVDVYNAQDLREQLSRTMGEGSLDIVLDVKSVDFVDVTGIGVIIAAAKRVGEAGGHITVRAPNNAVRRLVDLTKRNHFLSAD
jgi:anti-anti-sigma factor